MSLMTSLPSSRGSSPDQQQMEKEGDVSSQLSAGDTRHEREDIADLQELSDDLKALDEQTERAGRAMVFKRNKYIFLLQSMLLGMAYSMVWPTLLKYILWDAASPFRSEVNHGSSLSWNSTSKWDRLVYGMTYIAYPLGSMVSASLVDKMNFGTRSTKRMIIFLNMFEIIGNLLFTVSLVPFLPAVGRFIAGLGDAFYVVLMREMHRYTELSNERLTIECLAAFVLGVILSPGVNILTTFMHFELFGLRFNENNFPGLTIAVIFIVMQFVVAIFVRETGSDEEDEPQINQQEPSTLSKFHEATDYITELEYTAWFVNGFSFIYTYIVGLFELVIPFLMYQRLKASPIGVMLLYAIIGTVYAMFLLMTMTVSFEYQPEVFVCMSVVVEIAGLVAVMFFSWLTQYTVAADIVGMAVVALAVSALWSVDDVLFINLVQVFVPHHQKEKSHKVRKFVSKVAFALAGLTVPVMYPSMLFYLLPVLIVMVCVLFINFTIVKYLVSTTKKPL